MGLDESQTILRVIDREEDNKPTRASAVLRHARTLKQTFVSPSSPWDPFILLETVTFLAPRHPCPKASRLNGCSRQQNS